MNIPFVMNFGFHFEMLLLLFFSRCHLAVEAVVLNCVPAPGLGCLEQLGELLNWSLHRIDELCII